MQNKDRNLADRPSVLQTPHLLKESLLNDCVLILWWQIRRQIGQTPVSARVREQSLSPTTPFNVL